MIGSVFEVEPNKNWRLKSCKGLELMSKIFPMGSHFDFTFCPCEWLGVSIPDNENWVHWAGHEDQFCTSVSVLFAVLYVSFSPLHEFNFQSFVRLRKHSQPWKKRTYEILLDQFYIFECLKEFVIAVWPKNCPKLSKNGKLTVKNGRVLSNFPKLFFGTVLSGFSWVWKFIFVKMYVYIL